MTGRAQGALARKWMFDWLAVLANASSDASRFPRFASSISPPLQIEDEVPKTLQPIRNTIHTANMSSLVHAIIGSDNIPSSAPPQSSDPPPSRRRRGSSRGLPSESVGRSDPVGLPDDEVVGSRGTVRRPRGPASDIPKVVDEIGEHMVQQFEDFLET